MAQSVCLCFQIHQSARLRPYRFFDIGKDSHYYDDFAGRTAVRKAAQKSVLPMNSVLLEQIGACGGKFKVAFSISGTALEQFDRYAPEVLDSFRELAATGCVEFLCEPYYHSLASLGPEAEFKHQVFKHREAIRQYFGVEPVTFRNTELIYSDQIGALVSGFGFGAMITEGAQHVLGTKSPNRVYGCDLAEGLKLILRNSGLSDDLSFHFSNRDWCEWPITADKYAGWLKVSEGDVATVFTDYSVYGVGNAADSGIFDFVRALPSAVLSQGVEFLTPCEVAAGYESVGDLSVPSAISWAGDERGVTAWLGNELQQEAFNKLYRQEEQLSIVGDPALWSDYGHLQEIDNFNALAETPSETPYEAFINYMNILSDFIIRLKDEYANK